MSAIAGIVRLSPGRPADVGEVRAMLAAMRPSQAGENEEFLAAGDGAVVGKACFGPDGTKGVGRTVESRSVVCCCQGEFYGDSEEASGSADEFLLAEYLARGPEEFADELNGSFAGVIIDGRDASVTLVTDHSASCGLFTCLSGDTLYFASEVKGLLAVDSIPNRPDASSVISFLVCGFMVRRKTLVDGITQMDYATVGRAVDGKWTCRPYWRYRMEPDAGLSRKEALGQLIHHMRKAVKRRTGSGHPAILLSGGLDSRGILACMDEPGRIPAATYSGMAPERQRRRGDRTVAGRVAQQVGLELTVLHYDRSNLMAAMADSVYASDGAAGFIFENVWDNLRLTLDVDVVLTGDESFGHCAWPIAMGQVLSKVGIVRLEDYSNVLACVLSSKRQKLAELSEADAAAIAAGSDALTPYARVDEMFFAQRSVQFLAPKRRMIARHGLLVRNPWLDRELLEFVRHLPDGFRIRKSLYKSALRKLAPRLFSLPLAGEGEVPDYRKRLWELETQSGQVSKIVLEDNPLFEALFDCDAIRGLIDRVCAVRRQSGSGAGSRLQSLVPIEMQRTLAGYYRFFRRPKRSLSDVVLLLRLLAAAIALRYLDGRFRTREILPPRPQAV